MNEKHHEGKFEGKVLTEIKYIKEKVDDVHSKLEQHLEESVKRSKRVSVLSWVGTATISWLAFITYLMVEVIRK